MAKTIKVSFDYEGKHYDLKLQIKVAHTETGYALTKRDYNEDWELINYNERSGFFAAFNTEECEYTFEIELSWKYAEVLHLRVWTKDDGVLLDDESGVENFDMSDHGRI